MLCQKNRENWSHASLQRSSKSNSRRTWQQTSIEAREIDGARHIDAYFASSKLNPNYLSSPQLRSMHQRLASIYSFAGFSAQSEERWQTRVSQHPIATTTRELKMQHLQMKDGGGGKDVFTCYTKEGMGTETIIGIIRMILDKGGEWAHINPISTLQGDIKHAFDVLQPKHVAAALERRSVGGKLIGVLLEENSHLIVKPIFEDLQDLRDVNLNKNFRQGGTESPTCWNSVVQDVLAVLQVGWKEAGKGID